MPTDKKKLEKLLKIEKDGAIAVQDDLDDFKEEVKTLISEIQKSITDFKEDIKQDLKDTKGLIGELSGVERLKGDDGHTPTDEELTNIIKPLIPQAKDGKDGKTPAAKELLKLIRPLIPEVKDGETPTDERLISLIKPLIPEIKDGKDGSPDSGKDIINKINQEDELKIDRERIEGLDDELKSLGGRVVMTGQSSSNIIELTATGAKNGSNKDFTFSQKPRFVVINGSMYRENNGWSWGANDTATLDFAPSSNADIYGVL